LIGTTVSHYEILEQLGGGGMGVVYRARDTILDRHVALKFLPDELEQDPEALARFRREARAASALNHPHICTIYELAEDEGRHFLVMELLDGQTLKYLTAREPMPVERVVRIGAQVADALAAAHAEGIVHRDIKAANLFLTRRGDAKMLDFGLAKMTGEPARRASGRRPLETDETALAPDPLTTPGTAMGTIAYMSPEQVRGEDLDERTDLFSLGVVLYEMVTGKQPFVGDTSGLVFDQILNRAPAPPTSLNAEVPEELERILDKALEKDKALRYQHAADLRADLERLRRDTSSAAALASAQAASGAAAAAARAGRQRRPFAVAVRVAAAVLVVAAVGVGAWLLGKREPSAHPAAIRVAPFTSDRGWKGWPRFSPDGEKVAYAWYRSSTSDIYIQAIGGGARPFQLTDHPASEVSPAWSPDGREIAFIRLAGEEAAAVYAVSSLGGHPRKIADLQGMTEAPQLVPALSWSPDGEWLLFAERSDPDLPARIVRLSVTNLAREPLTEPPPQTAGDFYPVLSPDQSQLAFARAATATWGSLDVWVRPLAKAEARRLTFGQYDDTGPLAWTPDGRAILFASDIDGDGTIYRVDLDGGEPRPIPGVGQATGFATVGPGRLVYQQRTSDEPNVLRLPGRARPDDERSPSALIYSNREDIAATYSPDSRRIAFASRRKGPPNIWIANADGSDPAQLTNFSKHTGTPRWSPDGRWIVFDSNEAGDWNVYVIDAEGGMPRRLTRSAAEDGTGSWSRDGRWIYFHSNRGGSQEIWKIPFAGGEAVQVTRGGGFYAEESWDGETLYYVDAHDGGGIWRMPVAGGEATRVIDGPLDWLDWSLGPTGIYFATVRSKRAPPLASTTPSAPGFVHTILFLDFESGEATPWYRSEGPHGQQWLSVSPDEEWILFSVWGLSEAELMLVENFR
jgi:Tol biopolymer transport system component